MTLFVTTSVDSVEGSLRDALNKANLNPSVETEIIIRSSVKDPIKLTAGELTVSSNIHLMNDSGHDVIITQETVNERIFNVISPSVLFKISPMSEKNYIILTNGRSTSTGGAINVTSATNHLILDHVKIKNNRSVGYGGGIYTSGYVNLISSSISSNRATIQGGGIWSSLGVILLKSKVSNNKVTTPADTSAGGGIFIDSGDCVMNNSCVNNNQVAYNTLANVGGSGGGIVITLGSVYVQNESHVDGNVAYSSAGIYEGIGNVYILDSSTVNKNLSYNPASGLGGGGGGVTATSGSVHVSNSQVCDNITQGMYSGGILTLLGDANVHNNSSVMRNSNNGPGGGIAVNLGNVIIGSNSCVSHNTGASLGGGIVNFSPNPFTILISESRVSSNTLTNAQTIAQTLGQLLSIVVKSLNTQDSISTSNGGAGGMQFHRELPTFIARLTENYRLLTTPTDQSIGGGAIGCLSLASIIINDSQIDKNFAGKDVSVANSPFKGLGGGLYSVQCNIYINNSSIHDNSCLTSGGGIYNEAGLSISNSRIFKNTSGEAGGIATTTPITKYHTRITDNTPNNIQIIPQPI